MKYMINLCINFFRQMLLLALEVGPVFKYIRKMKAGAIDAEHPWATGIDAKDGTPIWPKNIVYQSQSTRFDIENDKVIATKIGKFLRSMVKRSLPCDPEIPQSTKRRMPHAVNYIHGAIHYNGVSMFFDDFADLRAHLGNPTFVKDISAFIKNERREVTFVMRERDYDTTDYAYCVAAMRAYLPYFTNGNGPSKKPVLWGNKSPYLAINSINGAWMDDMNILLAGKVQTIIRPPVSKIHFAASYALKHRDVKWVERLYAWLMFLDVRARGFGGQLFFTKRKLIEPKSEQAYKDAGGYWKWTNINHIPHPFQSIERTRVAPPKVSVIIPTLNESTNVVACIASVKKALKNDLHEIIVVDGGSEDNTTELAEYFGAKTIPSKKGRGNQMAKGAKEATGDLLFFVHADTVVAEKTGRKVRRFFSKPTNKICTLRLRFLTRNPAYKLLGWATRLDGTMFSYGDQGIIVRRTFYDQIGGMPEQVLFEDVEFFSRARREARVSSLRAKIYVSNRRFKRNGMIRELGHNTWLSYRYKRGDSPDSLAKRYKNW